MATAVSSATPSREDFAKLLEESFAQGSPQEGAVVKGTVVGIEKDLAVIDVGAKTEGRVALREFAGPGRQADIKLGDTVEVCPVTVRHVTEGIAIIADGLAPGGPDRRRRPIPAAAGRARRAPQGDAGERFVTVSSTHSESVTS